MYWIYQNKNVTHYLKNIYLGKPQKRKKGEKLYTYYPPIISEKTYHEIIGIIKQILKKKKGKVTKKKKKPIIDHPHYDYLRISKLTNKLIKSQWRTLVKCAFHICPDCKLANFCTCKNNNNNDAIIKCAQCHLAFMTNVNTDSVNIFNKKLSLSTANWKCKKCERKWSKVYIEFSTVYLPTIFRSNINNDITKEDETDNIERQIYSCLSSIARKELRYKSSALSYSIRIRKKDENNKKIVITIPPFIFLLSGGIITGVDGNDDENTTCRSNITPPSSFTSVASINMYNKILNQQISSSTVKTAFNATVLERMEKGKYSAVRQYCHNKRYVNSGRAIIVPCSYLDKPDQCILPVSMFSRMGGPQLVLAHRYPTLSIRNFTVHRVVGTWSYPVVGIATSVVRGHNADFDGDAMQIIPLTNPASIAEALTMLHPANNMMIPATGSSGGNISDRLRLTFDHDEILILYTLFGINGQRIHEALARLALAESSQRAYQVFCRLRRLARRAAVIHHSSVFGITYGHLSSLLNNNSDSDNTFHRIIKARSCRFSLDHLWQVKTFLSKGMDKHEFIRMAKISRLALIKDIAFAGYGYIKLLYCTRTLVVGYDKCVYTLTGNLVTRNVQDLLTYSSR